MPVLLVVSADALSPRLQTFLGGTERVVLGQPSAITRAFLDLSGGALTTVRWSLFELFHDAEERLSGLAEKIKGDIATEGDHTMDLGLKMVSLSEVFILAERLNLEVELAAIFRPKPEPPAEEPPDLDQVLLRTIRHSGGTATMAELCRATGRSASTLAKQLAALQAEGLVGRAGQRRTVYYFLPELLGRKED